MDRPLLLIYNLPQPSLKCHFQSKIPKKRKQYDWGMLVLLNLSKTTVCQNGLSLLLWKPDEELLMQNCHIDQSILAKLLDN